MGRFQNLTENLSEQEDIVKQYPTLFQGLGKLEGEHTIHLKEGATPRRVPLPLMEKVQEEIKRMEQLDVIEPVDEPTEWCSPIVVVPKADGRVRHDEVEGKGRPPRSLSNANS